MAGARAAGATGVLMGVPRRSILLGLVLTTGLAGCQPDLKMSPGGGIPTRDLRSCAVSGGTIQARGKGGIPMCVHPYSDAGKSCTGKSDCQGRCIADGSRGELPKAGSPVVGHCQADDRLFGCYAEVEGGKARPAICRD